MLFMPLFQFKQNSAKKIISKETSATLEMRLATEATTAVKFFTQQAPVKTDKRLTENFAARVTNSTWVFGNEPEESPFVKRYGSK